MTHETLIRTSQSGGQAAPDTQDQPLQSPWISLILATYGRSAELSVVLKSLAAQTESGFEVIVVDQNGDDRLNDVLASFPSLRIRHLRQAEPNLSLARNRGLDDASGDWVSFPDDDCWYEPDCLFKIKQALRSDKNLDGIVARWVEVEGPSARPEHELDRKAWRDFRGGDASSITLFLRREAVREQSGFDTRIGVGQFFGAGEETDLLLRLLDREHRLRYLPNAQVHHHFNHAVPALTVAGWQAALRRARGVGAIYAKHRLSPWVVCRGLVAPLVNPLRSAKPVTGLAFGLADVFGRLQGLVRWRRQGAEHASNQGKP